LVVTGSTGSHWAAHQNYPGFATLSLPFSPVPAAACNNNATWHDGDSARLRSPDLGRKGEQAGRTCNPHLPETPRLSAFNAATRLAHSWLSL